MNNNHGYEVPVKSELPATVEVTTPCTCGTKHRWFNCGTARIVARYNCRGFVDCPEQPLSEAIEEIEKLHPGMDLIFLGAGQPRYGKGGAI